MSDERLYKSSMEVIEYQNEMFVSVDDMIRFWTAQYKSNVVNVQDIVQSLIDLRMQTSNKQTENENA